jgi:hypothetical protein
MFNLNGHPYFGIDEKITLWKWYQKELDIPEKPDIRIMKLTIDGDMAWLGCEGIFPLRSLARAALAPRRGGWTRKRLSTGSVFVRQRSINETTARDGRCGRCGISTARRFRPRQKPARRSRTRRRNVAWAGIPGPLHSASSGNNDSGGSQWRGKIATSELRRPRFARRRTRDKCDEERPSSYRGCRDDDLVFARSRFRVHSAGQLIIREAA